MCVPCKRKCPQRQKEDVNTLELELLTVVSNLTWMLRTKLGSTVKTTVFNFWAISSVSQPQFLTYFIDVYFTHYKKLPVFWINRMVQLLALRHFCISHAHRQLLLPLCNHQFISCRTSVIPLHMLQLLCLNLLFSLRNDCVLVMVWHALSFVHFTCNVLFPCKDDLQCQWFSNHSSQGPYKLERLWKKVDLFPHQLTNPSVPCD